MDTDTSANLPQARLSLQPPIFIKTDVMQLNLFYESI